MPASPTFDERFDVLAGIAYRVAYRLVGDRGEAENLAQEAMARALVRWPRVHRYDEAWITRVTTNLAIGHWRRHRPTSTADPDRPTTADHLAERVDLARALRRLPKRQREVLALRYLADLTEVETADRLGCSVGSVKQHASRGLRAMRGLLVPDDDQDATGLIARPLDPTRGTEPC